MNSWSGCSKVYERPAALEVDYGEPVDKICKETKTGSNVFVREWTKAVSTLALQRLKSRI